MSDTATVVLARHGETVWHAENRYAGHSDIDLTERGLQQADALGQWAARTRPDAVYSSQLVRAVRTAEPAASALGQRVTADPRLREVNFGAGDGLTQAEMAQRMPESLASFLAHPARTPLPNGEAGVDAVARALPALDRIAADHANGTALVVMHSTLMRLILCELLGIDPDRYRSAFPRVINCALTTLRLPASSNDRRGPNTVALLGFNVPPYLPDAFS